MEESEVKIENENNTEKKMGLLKNNSGIGVIEVVLLLVVIIALIIIFKDKIIELLNAAFGAITEGAGELGV